MFTIFVTGATGFIGQNLLKHLKLKYNVITYHYTPIINQSVNNHIGEITDFKKLVSAMKGCHAVVHLAAVTDPLVIKENYSYARKINIQGTENVFRAYLENDIETFIFASTGKVYSPSNDPLDENHPRIPTKEYGRLKNEAESIIDYLCPPSKRVALLRLFNVYGPLQNERFIIPKVIKTILNEDEESIWLGNLKILRDYVHITDVVSLIDYLLYCTPLGCNAFNIGFGQGIEIYQLTKKIVGLFNSNKKIEYDKTQDRAWEAQIEIANISKIKDLGWSPRIDIDQGILLLKPYYA